MVDPALQSQIEKAADEAVRLAEDGFRLALDFSPESVERLETVLQRLHKQRKSVWLCMTRSLPENEKELRTFVTIFGAYLGEAIRRQCGGEWSIDAAEGNPGVLALTVNGCRLFPSSKVKQRLVDGPRQDVRPYFRSVIEQVRQTTT